MQTLWNALLRRWLDAEGEDAGVETLNGRLRRDIGLDGTETGFFSAQHIRERNLSDARSFLTLQAYR